MELLIPNLENVIAAPEQLLPGNNGVVNVDGGSQKSVGRRLDVGKLALPLSRTEEGEHKEKHCGDLHGLGGRRVLSAAFGVYIVVAGGAHQPGRSA